MEATITVGGRTCKQKLTIIVVANGRYIGGGMLVAPEAKLSDGLFDIAYVDAVRKTQILKLLPPVRDRQVHFKPAHHSLRAEEILIESPGMTVDLDGELIGVERAHYRMLPGGLRVACP